MKTNSEQIWYTRNIKSTFLLPISYLFCFIASLRRIFYKFKTSRKDLENVFIIVIGNITVGGTGKTPLVVYMAQHMMKKGLQVGVVSRGYKRAETKLVEVLLDSPVEDVGDEALLLKKNLDCPIVVAADRREAACYLHAKYQLDVILSDDGLQHYNLPRNFEICVIDGEREFGNARLLPAGPLREPTSRLNSVDLVVCNGEHASYEYQYMMKAEYAIALVNQEEKTLASFHGMTVHAIAGIGNPKRFFAMLEKQGIHVIQHEFADHHHFKQSDITFDDEMPVLLTEKDAVKCKNFAKQNIWYIPITLHLNAQLEQKMNHLIEEIH